MIPKKKLTNLIIIALALMLSSCSKIGYGVLLWSTEDPPIPSGSVMPVYIQSNIEQLWVAGVPETNQKIELPLTQLEFFNSKRKAIKRANEFSEYASIYAESQQDGLPIRQTPDNGSRRVYRLRHGEIIKVLDAAEGSPPIGTTGTPLEGDWLLVLTNDGTRGYCFSYRLKLFEHTEGTVLAAPVARRDPEADPFLEDVLSKLWVPDIYPAMINSRKLNLAELEKRYRFDPGASTGIARIIHPDFERDFPYEKISRDGDRAWFFDGSNLQMFQRTPTSLAVQFLEYSGNTRTIVFTALSSDIDDLIEQETNRREDQFLALFNQGPVFTSSNYGTIILNELKEFTWIGYDLLVPQFIPLESAGWGNVSFDIFITSAFADRYSGAINFTFTDTSPNKSLIFLYILDNMNLQLEVVPDYGLEDDTITRRSPNPMTLYFFKDELEY